MQESVRLLEARMWLRPRRAAAEHASILACIERLQCASPKHPALPNPACHASFLLLLEPGRHRLVPAGDALREPERCSRHCGSSNVWSAKRACRGGESTPKACCCGCSGAICAARTRLPLAVLHAVAAVHNVAADLQHSMGMDAARRRQGRVDSQSTAPRVPQLPVVHSHVGGPPGCMLPTAARV